MWWNCYCKLQIFCFSCTIFLRKCMKPDNFVLGLLKIIFHFHVAFLKSFACYGVQFGLIPIPFLRRKVTQKVVRKCRVNQIYSDPQHTIHFLITFRVSISSMDVGVVPDSTMSDDVSVSVSVSASHSRPPKGTIDLFSSPLHMPSQLSPMDREARVLRYREKKKARKFEKTIRYASRKAYAETRPRIKGRFAKRTDVEVDVDQMFSAKLMADGGYGIVPSF